MAPININDRDGDWLASLARQSAYAESTPNQRSSAAAAPIKRSRSKAGGGGGDGDNSSGAFATASSLTKIQRIERRDQKRIQREDRKRLAEVARQQRLSKKRRQNNDSGDKGIHAPAQSSVGTTPGRVERSVKRSTSMTAKSKQALFHLTTVLESTVSFYARPSFASTANVQRHSNRNQRDDSDSASQQQQIVNGVLADPKGKATKTSTLRPESKELQPRVRDYNGQGLVRPSLYIPFNDPSFKPKVEMEFEEHIPGFFGKAKQKAAKKQSDQNMLWKRCLKAKQLAEDGSSTRSTKRRKAKRGVGVEDRVEGLTRRGVM